MSNDPENIFWYWADRQWDMLMDFETRRLTLVILLIDLGLGKAAPLTLIKTAQNCDELLANLKRIVHCPWPPEKQFQLVRCSLCNGAWYKCKCPPARVDCMNVSWDDYEKCLLFQASYLWNNSPDKQHTALTTNRLSPNKSGGKSPC